MPLYRNIGLPLDIGKGRLIDGEGRGVFYHTVLSPAALEILEAQGKIARVGSPPLEAFPGWNVRSAKLARENIVTAEQFVEAPDEELAKILKVKPGTIAKYKAEVIDLLCAPKPEG